MSINSYQEIFMTVTATATWARLERPKYLIQIQRSKRFPKIK